MVLYVKALYVKVLAFLLSVVERRRGMADAKVIADVERRISAWQVGDKIHVYRSVIVREDGPVYAPVRDFLAKVDTEVLIRIMVSDPMMKFGEAELTTYRVVTP